MIMDKDLVSIQESRVLMENAASAQKELALFSQEKLDAIVEAMVGSVSKQVESLAKLSFEETGYGRWQDKVQKNLFVTQQVLTHLRSLKCVGVISKDEEQRTLDIGIPFGVLVGLSPVTSPVSTTIYKALIAIKSGNSIVFSPHPHATKCIKAALDCMIEAAEKSGLPNGSLSYMDTVTKEGTKELLNHPDTALILLSGVPGMAELGRRSGKPVIYSGTGNGPAFIERSADVRQAVQDIVFSKVFDNGISPSAEHSIIVDECIEPQVRSLMQEQGVYFMMEEESCALAELLFSETGKHRLGMVGVSAKQLAKRANFSVPDSVRLLVAERKYVTKDDPYSKELLAPVLAYYVEDDWMHACEKCIELLLHVRNAHTLTIHSNDEEVISLFALRKPVGRLLVNTPASFGGIGLTTNLTPSMSLANRTYGLGMTADNISPSNLTYIRKVGYGVRQVDNFLFKQESKPQCEEGSIDSVQKVIQEALRAIQNS
ncbi:aldehyde dehydrogenase family protein [Photobacterium kasasachensis]|uniref:aldehyde dehydrogenase family protein n=1 Tax=Photobacterium kasasachensis TaxID=2910240 RepID=UPI003D12CB63